MLAQWTSGNDNGCMHPTLTESQISTYSTLLGGIDLPPPTPSAKCAVRYKSEDKENIRGIVVPTTALKPSPGRSLSWPKNISIDYYALNFIAIRSGMIKNMRDAMQPVCLDGYPAGMEFRIMWPGYQHFEDIRKFRFNLVRNGKRITRWQLAEEILKAYEIFIDWAVRGATCANPDWQVPANFSIDRLYLDAVHNMDGHEAIFQARVIIL